MRSGKGWRSASPPDWVEVHATDAGAPGAPGPLAARGGWHALLIDEQQAIGRNEDSGQYLMWRALITDASGLGSAGRVEVSFDPSYQKVLLHALAVWRDGRRLDRLADARIELLRREAGLENESIDGRRTLMIILNDVRVGDVVETSYSILGQNPVHGPSHDGSLDTAFSMPVDRLFASVTSRSTRRLHVQAVRTNDLPAVRDEGGVQRWQLERNNVAAVQPEDGTPSDYAVFPRVDYSDDADWHEVAEWGTKLFKVDSTLGPDLEHRIEAWQASGLEGQALVSAALSLVQDDVRYFSASLGENSHRPKVPARTWADRAGDCKDKTALLVAILQRLGFDAKPALVSSSARNSLKDMLPRHDVFDHAIVRLQLDGRIWWLDGTMTSQSTRLDTRATPAFDWALVVAPGTEALDAVQAGPVDEALVSYDHVWDTSDLSKPARLQLTVTTRDDLAEDYRAAIASGHLAELVDNITSHYRTRFQDYRRLGEPVVQDDRAANRLSVRIEGEVPLLGDLREGGLAIEVLPLRIMDSLATPDQLQRTMPWAYEPPRTIHERVRLVLPEPPHVGTPPRGDVSDPHFALSVSASESGHERVLDWQFERRDDVVLPADLARFRDRITKARNEQDLVHTALLFDGDRLVAQTTEAAKAVDKDPRFLHDDPIGHVVARAFARRIRDDIVLAASGATSPIGIRMLVDRAMQDTLLGEDDVAKADLARVPADALAEPAAQYTRGVVLFTSGRFAESEKAFRASIDVTDPVLGPARRWIGVAAYFDGRPADAVQAFRAAVQDESGDEHTLALAWLFLAAQRQDHQGEAAIAPFLAGINDPTGAWSTQLLATMRDVAQADAKNAVPETDWANWPPSKALLEAMKRDPAKLRERAVQVSYYMSQLVTKPADRGTAVRILELEAQGHSPSVLEDVYARTELRKSATKVRADLMDSARKAAAAGDRRGAAAILWRAVAVAPDDTDALLVLGRVETDQDHCGGLELLTRAMSLRPQDPVIGIEVARALAICDERARSEATLAHWLADPSTPPAARAEGLAWRSRMWAHGEGEEQLALAESDAREALRIDAKLPMAWEALYHVDDFRDRKGELLKDVDHIQAAGAPPQDVSTYRGMALAQLDRDAEAEVELSNSLAVEPDNLMALMSRTHERVRRGDPEGATEDAVALTKLRPGQPEFWKSLQEAEQAGNHTALARDALDHEIELRQPQAKLWDERAVLDRLLGDHETAIVDYEKALVIDPSDVEAWMHRATQLWLIDRGNEAVNSCLKGIDVADVPLNRSACAVVEWEVGDHARAVKALDILPSYREDMEAAKQTGQFIVMGLALMSYGRSGEAVPFLLGAQPKQRDSNYVALLLYFARAMSGDERKAREEFVTRATTADSAWPTGIANYAAHRLDDDALRKLATMGAPEELAGQSCEATFYIGLRHWLDGDLAGSNALMVRAANECPRTFTEAIVAKAWLAAGPGASHPASDAPAPIAVAR